MKCKSADRRSRACCRGRRSDPTSVDSVCVRGDPLQARHSSPPSTTAGPSEVSILPLPLRSTHCPSLDAVPTCIHALEQAPSTQTLPSRATPSAPRVWRSRRSSRSRPRPVTYSPRTAPETASSLLHLRSRPTRATQIMRERSRGRAIELELIAVRRGVVHIGERALREVEPHGERTSRRGRVAAPDSLRAARTEPAPAPSAQRFLRSVIARSAPPARCATAAARLARSPDGRPLRRAPRSGRSTPPRLERTSAEIAHRHSLRRHRRGFGGCAPHGLAQSCVFHPGR